MRAITLAPFLWRGMLGYILLGFMFGLAFSAIVFMLLDALLGHDTK